MKITTIKLQNATKSRLDKLRVYKRETYEEILQKILELLNICRIDPKKAKARLLLLDNEHKRFKETAN